jgi:hypothetical protein
LVQIEMFHAARRGVALHARHFHQRAHQIRQPLDLFRDAGRGGVTVRGGLGQLRREAEARQRRTQFVRDVLQQAPLGGEQRLDALGHLIECARHIADLVAPAQARARREIAAAEALHGVRQCSRRGDAMLTASIQHSNATTSRISP